MPNPVLALALLMAASMGARHVGQKKVNDARAGAMKDASLDRRKHQQKSIAAAEGSIESGKNLTSRENAKKQELMDRYLAGEQGPNAPLPTRMPVPGSDAPEIVADKARQTARTDQFLKEQAANQATASAFGDVFTDFGLTVRRNAQDIDSSNTAIRNYTQNVLPIAMERASREGDSMFALGDMLAMFAQLYGMKALQAPPGTPGGGVSPNYGGVYPRGALGAARRAGGG